MIKIVRVDDKLLHGQVAFSWVRNLKIHTIIIADDRIVFDEFSKMTLGLSKPQGVNLQILEMKDAIEVLKNEEHSDLNVMAIVNCLENANIILEQIPSIKSLNLGLLRERYDTIGYSQNIALNDSEIKICKQLIEKGHEVEMRFTYQDKKLDISSILI